MEFRFCPKCGVELNAAYKFCPACGYRLESPGDIGAQTAVTSGGEDGDLFDFSAVSQAFDGQIARNAEYERTLTRARAFCVRGKYDEARAIYESLLEEDPGDMNGYMGLLRAATQDYTVYEGRAIDESIRVAQRMCGQEDLGAMDADYAKYAAERKAYFAEKAEKERKAKEEAEREAREIRENFTIENGVLEEYKGKGGAVVIPEGVTSIGDSAFSRCESLTSVTIPEGVTLIGNFAFDNCTSLTSVTIPSSVTSIEDGAFDGCESLHSVVIPRNCSIGKYAFPCEVVRR